MKIDGIIVAAGLSTRAGTHKMVLDVDGKTVIERCIESMISDCERVIVVGGYMVENIRDIVEKYSKVKLVYNGNYRDGMFSSVKEGLSHIEGDRFFLTPGDYPLIRRDTYREMKAECGDIVIPKFEGRKGHPILIDSRFIEDIIWNFEYKSLRDFVSRVGFKTVDVDDKGILLDIDTMEDYNAILKTAING